MDLSRFNQGGDFEPAPEGVHNAVCFAVIDLGTQEQMKFDKTGTESKPVIELRWEIDEQQEGGTRFMVLKRYTASMHEKATLRHHLEAWRGMAFKDADLQAGGFSMQKLLGAPCQIQVGRSEKGNAKILGIMKLAKGMKPLKPEIEPFMIDLESTATFDRDAYEGLSENMKATIAKSPEFQKLVAPVVQQQTKAQAARVNVRQSGGMSEKAIAVAEVDPFDDEIPF